MNKQKYFCKAEVPKNVYKEFLWALQNQNFLMYFNKLHLKILTIGHTIW